MGGPSSDATVSLASNTGISVYVTLQRILLGTGLSWLGHSYSRTDCTHGRAEIDKNRWDSLDQHRVIPRLKPHIRVKEKYLL